MLKRLILIIAAVLLIAGLVFGVIKIVPGDKTVEDAVSEVLDEITPVDKIEDTEPIADEDPETAVNYIDTTILVLLDDINADAETANNTWLNADVAISGFYGGVDNKNNLPSFYLISDDMNYAFDYIYCRSMSEIEIRLDAAIVVYGKVMSVSNVDGYLINVDRVEVKD